MKNKKPTQTERAITWMKTVGSLTSLEALAELGILSFPKRICEIKKLGYVVKDKWEKVIDKWGVECRIKRYYLIEEA